MPQARTNKAAEPNGDAGKPVDRRVQRTREGLHHALFDLILEKRYDKITVQDIIDRANVGRSTFYAHFLDKEDLLENLLRQLGEQLHDETVRTTPPADDHIVHSLTFFVHAHANRDFYRAMLSGGGGDLLLDTGRKHFTEALRQHLDQRVEEGAVLKIPTPVVAQYLAGAMMSVLTWWLAQDMPYPPEEIDDMYQALALPSIEALT